MRDFDPTFAAELAALRSSPFWSTVVRFVAGDFWIAGRENDAGGIDHAVIVDTLGSIGSTTGRSEPTQLDVAGTDVGFVNMPKRAGMPGPLATGERFIDRWVRKLEAVLADVYLNFETSPGTYVRERIFAAVCSSPSSADYVAGTLHLASRTERYLNASVLRKISGALYPFARESDVNSTIPIVIGAAPKSPGRVIKAGRVSTPVAGASNSSSAALLPPTADPAFAINETWTVTVGGTETAQFIGATNGQQDINLNAASGSTEPMLAQSFTLAFPQTVRSVSLKLIGSGTVITGPGTSLYCTARIEIWTDSGGNPGALVSSQCKITGAFSPWNVARTETHFFINPPSLAAGTYWLVVMASPGGHRGGQPWTTLTNTKIQWLKASGGGYSGGTAKKGTHTRVTYTTPTQFFNSTLTGVSWDSALAGQDFYFALALEGGGFTLEGSVTGVDGTGSVGAFFESDSGAITINSDRWQGTPAAGDTFTFFVDPRPQRVLFSESPSATPIGAITAVYFDDRRIADGTQVTQDGNAGFTFYRTLGEDNQFGILSGPGAETFSEWKGVYYPVNVVGTQSFTRLGWQVWRVGPANSQANPLRFTIYAGTTIGITPVPDLKRQLGSVSVDPTMVPILGVPVPYTYGDFEFPVTASDEKIWVGIETDQFSPDDFYELPGGSADATPKVVLLNHNGAFYVAYTDHPGFDLVGASVTTFLSTDDGTGALVALVELDFIIPDNVRVTADMAGITDDGIYSGTAGGVLFRPDQVIHWLLNRAGAVDADIDLDGTFDASAAFYVANDYRFDGCIQDDVTFKALILKLAYECRSSFDWIAAATLRVLAAELDEPSSTVELDDVLPNSERVPILRLERSADSELINSLTANFNRVLAATNYKSTLSRSVPDSITDFGVLKRTDLENLDFVRRESMARDIIDNRLKRQAYPVWRIGLTVLLPFMAVEKDDAVSLDLTNAAESGDALGGWDGSQVLQVEGLTYQPELPGLDLLLREVNVDVEIVEGDGYSLFLSIVVLLDQGDLTTTYDYVMGYPPMSRWTDPSTSGGTLYDAISLNTGTWFLYIENGVRKWRDTGGFASVFAWVGPPAARINTTTGLLEIDF